MAEGQAGRPGGRARLAHRALAVAGAAPRRLPRAGPDRLDLRRDRVRRAGPARAPGLTRAGLGGPVADHAAEARRAAAAGRHRAAGGRGRRGQHGGAGRRAAARLQHRRERHRDRAAPGWRYLTDGNVLVLGSGATACSALAALRETGADEVDGRRPVAWPGRRRCSRSRTALGIQVRLIADLGRRPGRAGPGSC